MRRVLAVLCLVSLSAACGGGSTTPGDDPDSALLTGKLVDPDGASASFAGTEVSAPDAGVARTADGQGEFDLGDLPAVRTRIRLRRSGHAVLETWIDLTDSTQMHVRLVVDGDRIARAFLEHCGRHHGSEAWDDMRRPARHDGGHDEPPAHGRPGDDGVHPMGDRHPHHGDALPPHEPREPQGDVGAHHDAAGHMGFSVLVSGLTPGASVEVVLIHPGGDEVSLGIFTVGDKGRLEARLEDGALPFGASHVRDLAGVVVEVRDAATGEVILSGVIPEVGDLRPRCPPPAAEPVRP